MAVPSFETVSGRAVKLKPYAIEARFGLIKALNALESWDKVKEHYEAILKIDPQNTTSLYWLGVLLYNRKDYDNAGRNFEKIVNLYPMDYGSVIMLAWTRLYQGKKTDARVLFNHALLLSPGSRSAAWNQQQPAPADRGSPPDEPRPPERAPG
jgi:tetratricopeptide (TPR) repeat protein